MAHDAILNELRMRVDGDEYQQIREEWIAHSKAEDARSLDGLVATLTEDCVYEVVNFGAVWRGHDGARAFYTELLGAFPDVHFDLQNIVIGPQGVWEEAIATGTHEKKWLHFDPSGERETFRVSIFFPWDSERKKFRGERVYTDYSQS